MSAEQPYTPSLDEGRRAWVACLFEGAASAKAQADAEWDEERAGAQFDRMIEAVRAEEREKAGGYTCEKDGCNAAAHKPRAAKLIVCPTHRQEMLDEAEDDAQGFLAQRDEAWRELEVLRAVLHSSHSAARSADSILEVAGAVYGSPFDTSDRAMFVDSKSSTPWVYPLKSGRGYAWLSTDQIRALVREEAWHRMELS